MGNENVPKNNNPDEALPTQNVNVDPALFETPDAEGQTSMIATTELLIVSFYITGRANPVIISANKEITIGRRDPKRRINPTIDLTEDHGAKLGVSRMHAEMNFVNGGYVLKDTGSSNGTWVNETKLKPYEIHPVKSGDQIRIGQIAIAVHITLPQRTTVADSVSTLIDETEVLELYSYKFNEDAETKLVDDGGLVMEKLPLVSDYLTSMTHIHRIIRDAQQQEHKMFNVVAIRARNVDNRLIVDITEGNVVMDFMATKYDNFVRVMEGKAQGDKKQTDSLQRYPDPIEQIADYALQELVFRFLNEARDDYVAQLATHFKVIRGLGLRIEQTIN